MAAALGIPGSRGLRRGFGYLWSSPVTLLGLLVSIGALPWGGRWRVVRGVLEVSDARLPRWLPLPVLGGVAAMTLGHVVLGRDADTLARWRDHEHAHVRQYERWGLLFPVAYFASSAHHRLCGRCPYEFNRFERQAFAVSDPRRRPAPSDCSQT